MVLDVYIQSTSKLLVEQTDLYEQRLTTSFDSIGTNNRLSFWRSTRKRESHERPKNWTTSRGIWRSVSVSGARYRAPDLPDIQMAVSHFKGKSRSVTQRFIMFSPRAKGV
jgi:hypothetical protein